MYLLSKTTKNEIERLLAALNVRPAKTLREINENRRARVLIGKLKKLKHDD